MPQETTFGKLGQLDVFAAQSGTVLYCKTSVNSAHEIVRMPGTNEHHAPPHTKILPHEDAVVLRLTPEEAQERLALRDPEPP